jgi:hypothetical protein
MVTAWLERDIRHRTSRCTAGSGKRIYFGMRTASALMPPPAYHFPVMNDYAAYSGIGTGSVQALFSELQGLGHVGVISRRKRGDRVAHCEHSPWNKVFSKTPSMAPG